MGKFKNLVVREENGEWAALFGTLDRWQIPHRPPVIARQIRYLSKQWDSFPENELRMGHLVKYGGTPETVRLKSRLV